MQLHAIFTCLRHLPRYRTMMNNPKTYKSVVLGSIHRAYRQTALYLEKHHEMEVSSTEAHMLAYLFREGPRRVGDLSRVFGLKKSTLTSTLDRLEKQKFVTRELNPNDRRSFLVASTPKAEALVKAFAPLLINFEQQVIASVSKRDLEGFAKVMEAVDRLSGIEIQSDDQSE